MCVALSALSPIPPVSPAQTDACKPVAELVLQNPVGHLLNWNRPTACSAGATGRHAQPPLHLSRCSGAYPDAEETSSGAGVLRTVPRGSSRGKGEGRAQPSEMTSSQAPTSKAVVSVDVHLPEVHT